MTVRDLIPLIKCNDLQLVCNGEELCLIRNDYIEGMFSEKYLSMLVDYIENDESVPDTIIIHVNDVYSYYPNLD